MIKSRHIFIQIDTCRVIKIANKYPMPSSPIKVREYSRLYDQGSMVIGNSIKTYDVKVNPDEDLQFTILPHHLFSFHKVYFTGFSLDNVIKIQPLIPVSNLVSFRLAKQYMPIKDDLSFCLYGILEYQEGPNSIQTQICIDPVLRADQGQ